YFVVAESLANVAKHSQATRAWVRARIEGDELVLSVRDNGVGGASLDAGTGVLGIADRVDAIGGSIALDSPRGAGTTVTVRMPVTHEQLEAAEAGPSAVDAGDPDRAPDRSIASSGLLVAAESGAHAPDGPSEAGVGSGGIGTPADV
ncbi:MAG TPA: ATP-binding protein, partial [Agromyces sp.]|nr:ATP-binding protein [Agromyces sp.]